MLVKLKTTGEFFTACSLQEDTSLMPRWAVTHMHKRELYGNNLIRDQQGERIITTPDQFNIAYDIVPVPFNVRDAMEQASTLRSLSIRYITVREPEARKFILGQMLGVTQALAETTGTDLSVIESHADASQMATLFISAAICEDLSTEPIDTPPLIQSLYAHLKGATNG